jgi:GTP-binding protein
MIQSKGLGIINTLFLEYRPHAGALASSPHGSLIAFETGASNSYGLKYAQERGQLFIGAAVPVYEGMVVGQNAKDEDMMVNVCKEKQLTNMRSKGEGVAVQLDTPRAMGLEDALEYIADDELVEVTPQNIRIRKRLLKEHERRRAK